MSPSRALTERAAALAEVERLQRDRDQWKEIARDAARRVASLTGKLAAVRAALHLDDDQPITPFAQVATGDPYLEGWDDAVDRMRSLAVAALAAVPTEPTGAWRYCDQCGVGMRPTEPTGGQRCSSCGQPADSPPCIKTPDGHGGHSLGPSGCMAAPERPDPFADLPEPKWDYVEDTPRKRRKREAAAAPPTEPTGGTK